MERFVQPYFLADVTYFVDSLKDSSSRRQALCRSFSQRRLIINRRITSKKMVQDWWAFGNHTASYLFDCKPRFICFLSSHATYGL